MARNATRNSRSNARRPRATPATHRPVKLSQRGVLVVSVLSGALVIAAANGHAGHAAIAGYALYLLVTGKSKTAAQKVPDLRNALRALCWSAVAVAALMALHGTEAPGGTGFGLALAAALTVALMLTGGNGRRSNGRNARGTSRNTTRNTA